MGNKAFKFKQFTVHQDRCAMKIGTDGVLLGAWVSLTNTPESILDIGAGTGVISLQLAQRSTAEAIDAIEIEDHAYEQCTENFENSPWADRLFCYHASVQEFASEVEDEAYDLIVSNPPFYSEDYKSDNTARDQARFTDALPFRHLVVCAAHLLADTGVFAVIIPKKAATEFIAIAAENRLYPQRICEVKGTPTAEIKRSLIEFTRNETAVVKETLIIETARHDYTAAYTTLVQDFYLKM